MAHGYHAAPTAWKSTSWQHFPMFICGWFQFLLVLHSGPIAASVVVRLCYEDRVHFSGKLLLQSSLILFWSFSDPIHPQVISESYPHSLKFSNTTFSYIFNSFFFFNYKVLSLKKLKFLNADLVIIQFEQNKSLHSWDIIISNNSIFSYLMIFFLSAHFVTEQMYSRELRQTSCPHSAYLPHFSEMLTAVFIKRF
jgi:hypothetical protein